MSNPLVLTDAELVAACGFDIATPVPTLDGLDGRDQDLLVAEGHRSLQARGLSIDDLRAALGGLTESPQRVVVEQLFPPPAPDAVSAVVLCWVPGPPDGDDAVLAEERTADGRHVFNGLRPAEVTDWLALALGLDLDSPAPPGERRWVSPAELTADGPIPAGDPLRPLIDDAHQVLAIVQDRPLRAQRLLTAHRSAHGVVLSIADPSEPRGVEVRPVSGADLLAALWPDS